MSELSRAIDANDAKKVRALLAAGETLRACSALLATETSTPQVVLAMLEGGVPVDTEEGGETLMHYAARNAAHGAAIIPLLVARGLDVNRPGGYRNQTPLHNARRREVITALAAAGASVDVVDSEGAFPFDYHFEGPSLDALLAIGPGNAVRNAEGRNPFLQVLWVSRNMSSLTAMLAAGAEATLLDAQGLGAMHCVACFDMYRSVGHLVAAGVPIDQAGEDGLTPLHVAVVMEKWEVAKALVEAGADPNAATTKARRKQKWPPLPAIPKGATPISLAGGEAVFQARLGGQLLEGEERTIDSVIEDLPGLLEEHAANTRLIEWGPFFGDWDAADVHEEYFTDLFDGKKPRLEVLATFEDFPIVAMMKRRGAAKEAWPVIEVSNDGDWSVIAANFWDWLDWELREVASEARVAHFGLPANHDEKGFEKRRKAAARKAGAR